MFCRESEDNAQWLRRQLRLAQNTHNKQVQFSVLRTAWISMCCLLGPVLEFFLKQSMGARI
jgi:hypothetical protein